jgi:hypothetical protein
MSGSAATIPPRPASAPSPSGVPNGSGAPPAGSSSGNPMLDAFQHLAANPELGLPPQPRTPGSFGAFDEPNEREIFDGPMDKGFQEGLAQSFGFREANPTVSQMANDLWDNLTEGAKNNFQELRKIGLPENPGSFESGAHTVVAGALTPISMIGQGIIGMVKAAPTALGQIESGLANPEADADGVTGRQRVGRGIGTLLGLVAQVAIAREGEKAGAALKTGVMGEKLQEAAAGPGNAMVRARKANYAFGKNPGDYLVDEPVKPPINPTRLGQLENIRTQNVAHGEALHTQINNLLRGADQVGGIMPDGQVRMVPQLLDWFTGVENAAEETKRDLQKQSGAPSRAKIAKAVNEMRDDILQEHDIEGKPTRPKQALATPTEVNNIKKSLGGRPNWRLITDPDAAETAAIKDRFVKKTYGKLRELVDGAVGGPAGKRVNDLNRRYSNAIEFRELLDDEIAKEKGTGGDNALKRKLEWLGAGSTAFSHPYLAATLALNRMLRSVPGRVIQAKGLAAAGAALRSPAARVVAPAAGAAAGAVPAVSAAARRVLGGQEETQ